MCIIPPPGLSALAPEIRQSPPSPFGVMIAGMGGNRAENGIVGVALFRAAIQGVAIERHQRGVEEQSYHEVRIGNEGLAEGDEVGAPLGDGFVGAGLVEAIVG